MERARSVVSLLLVYNKKLSTFDIEKTPEAISVISENLFGIPTISAKSYQKRGLINHSDERYIYEIYGKAILAAHPKNLRKCYLIFRGKPVCQVSINTLRIKYPNLIVCSGFFKRKKAVIELYRY